MKQYLRIGELASQMGLNPKTIRYYEEFGILNPVRGGNGYRLFSVEDAAQLRFVAYTNIATLTEILFQNFLTGVVVACLFGASKEQKVLSGNSLNIS